MSTGRTISQIAEIRADNNALWMDLLSIALEHAPEQTKAVLRAINHNDQRVSSLLKELAK